MDNSFFNSVEWRDVIATVDAIANRATGETYYSVTRPGLTLEYEDFKRAVNEFSLMYADAVFEPDIEGST